MIKKTAITILLCLTMLAVNAQHEFITTWQTTTANESITIPINSNFTYNYTVDWGDGNTTTGETTNATHSYAIAGNQTIKITGTFPAIYFNNSGDKDKITAINQWGNQVWSIMTKAFWGCSNLQGQATDVPNLSSVTDMSAMFRNAIAFNQDISSWNVSAVTNMSRMFNNAYVFNQDINSWDVSNVTDMSAMFSNAFAFNQNLSSWNVSAVTNMSAMFRAANAFSQDISSWNVSAVTNMSAMFRNNTAFNQDISSWNVSAVTDMSTIFRDATAFNQDISSWDVSNVTNMSAMFRNASVFNQDISSWNVGSATSMFSMFRSAAAFNKDISSWDVSNVTNMSAMFRFSLVFNQDISSWDVSSVTNMSLMFFSAPAFNQNLSSWNISNVTNMNAMFFGVTLSTTNYDVLLIGWSAQTLQPNVTFDGGNSNYCTAVAARAILEGSPNNWTITDGGFDCTIPATYFITTWQTTTVNESITIPTNPDPIYTYNYTVDWGDGNTTTGETINATHTYIIPGNYTVKISGTFPAIYFNNSGDKDKITAINQWGNQVWSSMSKAFFGCSNLQGLATDVPNLSNVTDMSVMFNNAYVFNQDINSWNVSNVINMNSMFTGAAAFNQDLSSWNVSSVESMASMFSGATAFNQNLSFWNVSNVTEMGVMFALATSFDQNLSSWNVSNVTNMFLMFNGVTLSTANYDALLTGWSAQTLQPNVIFDGGNSKYCTAVVAHAILEGVPNNWTISDGGQNCTATDYFITTWQTTTANESITIPTNSNFTYSYTVDWGDGNTTTGETANATHIYTVAGSYTVKISGTFPAIYFNNSGDKDKITAINQWGSQVWSSMNKAFYGCSNLQGPATDAPDLSSVTDMKFMFLNATIFNQDINSWDVSNVTIMAGMFGSATAFNQDISSWDVSGVTDMSGMFGDATVFNKDISSWNVSSVTDMTGMFDLTNAFNQDISSWDVSSVTKMTGMFGETSAFNQDISSWDVSNVTHMDGMFYDAVFNQDINSWDVSNVTRMSSMFALTTVFNQNLSSWDVSNVIHMTEMFNAATAFNQNISFWDVSSVTRMTRMFKDAAAFNQNISSWNVSNVTQMTEMFNGVTLSTANYDALLTGWSAQTLQPNVTFDGGNSNYCTAIVARAILEGSPNNWTITDGGLDCPMPTDYFITTWETTTANESITIPVNTNLVYSYTVDWGDGNTTVGETTNATHIYATAGNYTVKISGTFPAIRFSNLGDKDKITAINQWGNQVWSAMDHAFEGCSNLQGQATDVPNLSSVTNMRFLFSEATVFNQDLSTWNVSNVTDMNHLFNDATAFNQNLSSWNVANVTDMGQMFAHATAFNQDLSSWNVASVTDMNSMFVEATAFNQDISSWIVSNVIYMNAMFAEATVFNQDLSSWNVSSVENMSAMFFGTIAFNQDLSTWNTSNVTDMFAMFASATAFDQNLGSWDVSNVFDMEFMFDGVTLSTTNYDALLIGWSAQTLQPNVTFSGGNSIYCTAVAARAILEGSPNNWTITDGGLDFIDNSVTQNAAILTANASGLTYQWLDCNNGNALIVGETNQSFTATTNGSYAVIIANGNCDVISDCQNVVTLSVSEVAFGINIIGYPNPTNGEFTIDLGDTYIDVTISISNTLGQVIDVKNYDNQNTIKLNINGVKGIYFLQIENENGEKYRLRIIKN